MRPVRRRLARRTRQIVPLLTGSGRSVQERYDGSPRESYSGTQAALRGRLLRFFLPIPRHVTAREMLPGADSMTLPHAWSGAFSAGHHRHARPPGTSATAPDWPTGRSVRCLPWTSLRSCAAPVPADICPFVGMCRQRRGAARLEFAPDRPVTSLSAVGGRRRLPSPASRVHHETARLPVFTWPGTGQADAPPGHRPRPWPCRPDLCGKRT